MSLSVLLFLAWSLLGVSFGEIGPIGTPLEDIPRSIDVSSSLTTLSFGETTQLTVVRTLRDGSTEDITNPATGTTYQSVDRSIATVDASGLVVANAPGQTTIFVTTSTGHSAFLFLEIVSTDTDDDGLPDYFEVLHGLNPNDSTDSSQDADSDGFTNVDEFIQKRDPLKFDLNTDCLATSLNRTTQIDPFGNFSLPNVPVPVGVSRVRIICERNGRTIHAQSSFLTDFPNGITLIGEFLVSGENSLPNSIEITSPGTVLTSAANNLQLVTTGTLANGTQVDLTLENSGTFYRSSNPAIATVSADGLVNAVSSGNVLITSAHEGVMATIALSAILSSDEDGDGLPDDFELANAVNPGGANLALLSGAVASASSFSGISNPTRTIDGDPSTSWLTSAGDAANQGSSPFIEVTLLNRQLNTLHCLLRRVPNFDRGVRMLAS